MSHTVEILSVGTELLLGNIVNLDAQILSEGLSALGLNVYYHTVVGDNPQRAKEAVAIAKSRADIIITTGGLGPTCDDLTKNILAEAFGKELYFDEDCAAEIRDKSMGHRPWLCVLRRGLSRHHAPRPSIRVPSHVLSPRGALPSETF